MIEDVIKTYPHKKTDPRMLQHTGVGHYHTANKHNHLLDFFPSVYGVRLGETQTEQTEEM